MASLATTASAGSAAPPSSSPPLEQVLFHVRLIDPWRASPSSPSSFSFFGLDLELHGHHSEGSEPTTVPLSFAASSRASQREQLRCILPPFHLVVASKMPVETATNVQKPLLQATVPVQPLNALARINRIHFLKHCATGADIYRELARVLDHVSVARPFELTFLRHNHAQASAKITPFAARVDVQRAQVAQFQKLEAEELKWPEERRKRKQFVLQQMDFHREAYLYHHIGTRLLALHRETMADGGQWHAYEFERVLWYYHAPSHALFAEHPMRNSASTRQLIGSVQLRTRVAAQRLQQSVRRFLRWTQVVDAVVDALVVVVSGEVVEGALEEAVEERGRMEIEMRRMQAVKEEEERRKKEAEAARVREAEESERARVREEEEVGERRRREEEDMEERRRKEEEDVEERRRREEEKTRRKEEEAMEERRRKEEEDMEEGRRKEEELEERRRKGEAELEERRRRQEEERKRKEEEAVEASRRREEEELEERRKLFEERRRKEAEQLEERRRKEEEESALQQQLDAELRSESEPAKVVEVEGDRRAPPESMDLIPLASSVDHQCELLGATSEPVVGPVPVEAEPVDTQDSGSDEDGVVHNWRSRLGLLKANYEKKKRSPKKRRGDTRIIVSERAGTLLEPDLRGRASLLLDLAVDGPTPELLASLKQTTSVPSPRPSLPVPLPWRRNGSFRSFHAFFTSSEPSHHVSIVSGPVLPRTDHLPAKHNTNSPRPLSPNLPMIHHAASLSPVRPPPPMELATQSWQLPPKPSTNSPPKKLPYIRKRLPKA